MLVKVNNPLNQCNLKFANNKKGEFSGYASVFNGNDSDNDTIEPGAFEETLKSGRPPAMFINHDSWEIPVGDWVDLKEDDRGLFGDGLIDLNHKDGPTAYSAMKRGALDGLSIGFRIPPGGATEKKEGHGRIIHKVELKEISIVTFPADDSARITAVKTEIENIETIREAEIFLRDSGIFSKATAIAFVSRIKDFARRDAEEKYEDEIAKLNARLYHASATESLIKTIQNL